MDKQTVAISIQWILFSNKKEWVTDVLIFYNLEESQGIMWMEKAILKRFYTIWLHSHDYSLEDITTTTENRQVVARN